MRTFLALCSLGLLFLVKSSQSSILDGKGLIMEPRYADSNKCNPGCGPLEQCCDDRSTKRQKFCAPAVYGKDCYETMLGKTFLFAIEGAWEPYGYIDPQTGKAVGFLFDVVKGACGICGRKCDTVFIGENIGRCYDPALMGGEGLNKRDFDACVGWSSTQLRKNTVKFSAPFLEPTKGQIYVKKGSDISKLDDLEGKTIGFRKYWFMDKFCYQVNVPGMNSFTAEEIPVTNGWIDVLNELNAGNVDAAMLPAENEGRDGLVAIGNPFDCTSNFKMGVMHRKDVNIEWFETCLNKFKSNKDVWQTLCQEWGVTNCLM